MVLACCVSNPIPANHFGEFGMKEENGLWFTDTDAAHDRRQWLQTLSGIGYYLGAVIGFGFIGACALLVGSFLAG